MLLINISILITFSLIGLILVQWRRRYQQRSRLRRLRTWATQSTAVEPVLQAWIEQMSSAQLTVLLDLLHGYCASLHWQLDWLFMPQIESAPALHTAVEEGVSSYARTILLSLQLAEDVQAYQAYLAFEKQPYARKQQPLVQNLYAKIQHERVTPAVQGFFRRFSDQDTTQTDQVAAIREAFAQDPANAMGALKEVLATSDLR